MKISIVICTHNREQWLKQALESLQISSLNVKHPLQLIVVMSACTDNTASVIYGFSKTEKKMSIKVLNETRPGRSLALNLGLGYADGDLIALIDDDHIVDKYYLENVVRTADQHPEVSGFCGKIVPLWDGTEPAWVHDEGPTAIRPFPIPNFDLGESDCIIDKNGFIPGAGNLILRKALIDNIGFFREELGPKGHNLAGGEDVDYVLRAMAAGHRFFYSKKIIQYHQIDKSRLRLSYLMKKAFLRHRVLKTIGKQQASGRTIFGIPLYLFLKLFRQVILTAGSPELKYKRYGLVRLSGHSGEIIGHSALFWEQSLLLLKIRKTVKHYIQSTAFLFRAQLFKLFHPGLLKPVFVIGCSRSGTTAVYKTLSASRYLGSLQKETHEMWERLHPIADKNYTSHALESEDAGESDRNVIDQYFYSRLGRKRIVDKANQNCFRIPYLLKLYPDAFFVWVKRNGPDNINSLIHGWGRPEEYGEWAKDLPVRVRVEKGRFSTWCFFLFQGWRDFIEADIEEVCANQWIEANQSVIRSRSLVPEAQWLELKYEDILKDAENTFRPVFQKLGIPFDNEMKLFCSGLVQNPYNAFSPPRLDKWKEENPERIKRILGKIEPTAKALDYDN